MGRWMYGRCWFGTYIYTEESIAKASSPQDELFKAITYFDGTGQDTMVFATVLFHVGGRMRGTLIYEQG